MEQNDYLAHHGILGMKWGVRRYQNQDGSRTEAGRIRYGYKGNKTAGSLDDSRRKYEAARNAEKKNDSEWISRALKKDLSEEEGDKYDRESDRLFEERQKARKEYRDDLNAARKEAAAKHKKLRQKEEAVYKEWIDKARKKSLTEKEGDQYDNLTTELFEKKKEAKKEYVNAMREIIKDAVKYGVL